MRSCVESVDTGRRDGLWHSGLHLPALPSLALLLLLRQRSGDRMHAAWRLLRVLSIKVVI